MVGVIVVTSQARRGKGWIGCPAVDRAHQPGVNDSWSSKKTHLGGHHPIHPGQLDTPVDILPIQDVPIRKDRHFDSLLDRPDLLPIC
jgi:hypothetical protein